MNWNAIWQLVRAAIKALFDGRNDAAKYNLKVNNKPLGKVLEAKVEAEGATFRIQWDTHDVLIEASPGGTVAKVTIDGEEQTSARLIFQLKPFTIKHPLAMFFVFRPIEVGGEKFRIELRNPK